MSPHSMPLQAQWGVDVQFYPFLTSMISGNGVVSAKPWPLWSGKVTQYSLYMKLSAPRRCSNPKLSRP